ncbi:MAG: RHS repeat-associated core domain-containing protein [Pseudomonadota bacterium]
MTITEDTNYTIGYAYNAIGAVDTVTYPGSTGSPFVLKYIYSYGAAQQVKDNVAGTVFWSLSGTNDSALPTAEVLGNSVAVTSGYTPWTNDIVTRQEGTGGIANSLQDLAYQWDPNGNLLQRQDNKQTLTEVFVHDAVNRLSSSTLNGATNLTVGYDAAGNITSKSDVGAYDYTTAQGGCTYQSYAQPHAVRNAGGGVYCYDANGNAISRGGGALVWTSYNLPSSITYGSNSTSFNYNSSHQRWKQDANYAGTHEVTYYVGGLMEKVTTGAGPTEYRHLIPAGNGSAILTRRSNLTSSVYYTTSDHLGSGDLILSSTGTILAKESFTAFGARRGSNWQGIPSIADYSTFSSTTRRGFTGHEMLDSVSLIHMNGRVYDPTIGRFLSADPIIQTIQVSQALNAFSYVMNNPLALIDPTGYSWLSELFSGIGHFFKKWGQLLLSVALTFIAGPFISALIMGAIYGGNFQSFVIGFAVGMIAGAIAGPMGGSFAKAMGLGGSGFVATVLRGAIVGGLAGGISSVAMGGSFGQGFAAGALGGAAGAALNWGAQALSSTSNREVGDRANKMTGEVRQQKMDDEIAAFKKANPDIHAMFDAQPNTWAISWSDGATEGTVYESEYGKASRTFEMLQARYGKSNVNWLDAEPGLGGVEVHLYATFAADHSDYAIYGWSPSGDFQQGIIWHEIGHLTTFIVGGGGFPGLMRCYNGPVCESKANDWAKQHFH